MPGLEVFNEMISTVGGGALLIWILVKLTRLETRMEGVKEVKDDVKKHGERLTLVEPKAERAHERCDEFKEKFKTVAARFDSLGKRGMSS